MTDFFSAIEIWFQGFALMVPLPWFVFVGSALEELVSLIPASLIMGLAGSVSLVRGYGIFYLMFLAFIGNIGRLFGAYFYYWLGDRLEDALIPYFKRFLGVGHEEVEGLGKRFSGRHYRDGMVLFFMRATPFFPVTVTSIACGVIKMNLKVYLTASFLGNFCKDFLFLTVGYIGLASMKHAWKPVQDYKWYVDLGVGVLIVALFVTLYLHRGRGRRLVRAMHRRYRKFVA
jgi:membrane protein DedA with SNARE-associated domain